MVRKANRILAGFAGAAMLFGSMGTVLAQPAVSKDYEGHWAQQTIQSWLDSGLLKGFGDGSVKPNQTITRAEFMTLINRSYHFTEQSKVKFTDVPSTSWVYSEVAKAVAAGYIQGFNNEMRPNAPINRQEAAVIVTKLLKLSAGDTEVLKGFSDAGQMASWSKGSIAAAVTAGVLKGYPDGTFGPVKALTRAESLALIDASVSRTGQSAQGAATPAPAVTPSATPVAAAAPTVTAAVAAGGSGGGSGSGGGGGGPQVTPTPAPAATPAPVPTPTPSPEPVNELPVKELPALDISITSRPDNTVTNTVYLEIDYSRVLGSAVSLNDRITYYVTAKPISSRDLHWKLTNLQYASISTGYSLGKQTGIWIPASKIGAAGDKYVSVLVRNSSNEVTGFYTQQVNLQPTVTEASSSIMLLHSGVTITQEKFSTVSSQVYYRDTIDVEDAALQFGGRAVGYTITPKYYMDSKLNLELNDIIHASRKVYRDSWVSVIDATVTSNTAGAASSPGYIPFAYDTLYNFKTYNEDEYTIIFLDSEMKALGFYTGKVMLSTDLKLEAAMKRIDELPSNVTLMDEDAVNRAYRAYLPFDDSFNWGERKNKLKNAVSTLMDAKKSGPLQNMDLVQSVIIDGYNQFNGKTISMNLMGYPDELKESVGSFSYYITANPVRAEDLAQPSPYGKINIADVQTSVLAVTDKSGQNYVTVVYYNKEGQAIRYATKLVDFTPKQPVWDGTATQVHDGIKLVRDYNNGTRIDYVSVQDYQKMHPEAVFFTATSKSALAAAKQEFTAESAVKYLNDYRNTNSIYLYERIQLSDDAVRNGQPEDYIILFYDANYKALNYYVGGLTD
ncbi:Ig domain-containing protein [Paenibacillus sp. FSL R7-269]|uniref:S-layer homology domain-containing protein n=1 Tax=Paenibacillus sp. FSL R7-269 TaxID=1226755 RepID=UPI0003E21B9C|nr:S-layer homology domain-containing protein [Paenibacillus sp. FSL R7-269]ETT48126.1 Ig domain-containing protein [Paenibacillus sp. FSL R7-269]